MAELATTTTNPPLAGEATAIPNLSLMQNPLLRQLGLMVGIALSVALGVAVVLWSQAPNYSVLVTNMAQADASEIVDLLRQSQIEFKLDQTTGAVMVPSAKLSEAKLKLAGAGLPRSEELGFELLQQERGFGSSRLVEAARYQKAIEGELARTISTINSVQSARVHLAMPKRSVFVQPRKVTSASVAVKLHPGRILDRGQVESIIHLVASSVPELEASHVTLVDHQGRLLSGRNDDRALMMSARQFEYARQLEDHYKSRVEDILAPMIGMDKVRAEITADLDFTRVEQTEERYNPDAQAVRSEQLSERASNANAPEGVPGALTNQPPAAGVAPEQANGGEAGGAGGTQSSSKNTTRNYEVDKTISHTQNAVGRLRRLSVAVVVDDRVITGPDGAPMAQERSAEEIQRITQLVREAVGFDAQRGDSVRVINTPFQLPTELDAVPELPLWEQPWFLDLVKQLGGILLVLVLIFAVIRPAIHRLTHVPVEPEKEEEEETEEEKQAKLHDSGRALLGADGQPLRLLTGRESYEEVLDAARGMVQEDPKRVAQLMKAWVAEGAD
ncbi:MAG: flagellar M-ring protein FliF [Gammaproteobacteria bacterium SHHR-1]|uniref:flagellar basal-body MS-ring/collar protein FliF n=1 Tax=Magnetovirga frankeli TaxID=947516 RepID=UPI001293F2BB|nr:flagellar M-ring protein FliF [gamma proteobacterium SS-5]